MICYYMKADLTIIRYFFFNQKDYAQLQSLMLSDLEEHYASDNVSIEDKYSRAWNEFFIKVRIISCINWVFLL